MPESEAKRCFLRSWSCWTHKTLESNMSDGKNCARPLILRRVSSHAASEGCEALDAALPALPRRMSSGS